MSRPVGKCPNMEGSDLFSLIDKQNKIAQLIAGHPVFQRELHYCFPKHFKGFPGLCEDLFIVGKSNFDPIIQPTKTFCSVISYTTVPSCTITYCHNTV